jgi:hypothetical protein
LGAALLIAGCSREVSYRYRMTAYVQTPAGVRSGSGVIEVWSRRRFQTPLEPGGYCEGGRRTIPYTSGVRGQAVAVDLGGRTLFVLLRSPQGMPANHFPPGAFRRALGRYDNSCPSWPDESARARILKEQTHAVEIDNPPPSRRGQIYPALARFANLNDPRTMQLLDRHDLARDLGAGYRLLRITLEITDDPVTEGIETRLPWLRTVSGEIRPYAPARLREAYRVYTSGAFLSRDE